MAIPSKTNRASCNKRLCSSHCVHQSALKWILAEFRSARAVRPGVLPVFHQRPEARIGAFRQDDLGCDQQIATITVPVGQSLALQTQTFARAHAGRDLDLALALKGRNADLGAQDGFIERQRQIEADVVVFHREQLVWQNLDRHQSIAGRTGAAFKALPLHADGLTILDALGHSHVQCLAGWQMHTTLLAGDKVFQRHAQLSFRILPLLRLGAMMATMMGAAAKRIGSRAKRVAASPTSATGHVAENLAENVFSRATSAEGIAAPSTAKRIATTTERVSATSKTLEFLLALGVNFAAVIFSTLLLVTYNLVGLIDFGKLFLSFGIALVLIGVVFLRKLAKSALDFALIRRLGHPKHAVWISHQSRPHPRRCARQARADSVQLDSSDST